VDESLRDSFAHQKSKISGDVYPLLAPSGRSLRKGLTAYKLLIRWFHHQRSSQFLKKATLRRGGYSSLSSRRSTRWRIPPFSTYRTAAGVPTCAVTGNSTVEPSARSATAVDRCSRRGRRQVPGSRPVPSRRVRAIPGSRTGRQDTHSDEVVAEDALVALGDRRTDTQQIRSFAAQSRLDPVPSSSPANTTSGVSFSRYRRLASEDRRLVVGGVMDRVAAFDAVEHLVLDADVRERPRIITSWFPRRAPWVLNSWVPRPVRRATHRRVAHG